MPKEAKGEKDVGKDQEPKPESELEAEKEPEPGQEAEQVRPRRLERVQGGWSVARPTGGHE